MLNAYLSLTAWMKITVFGDSSTMMNSHLRSTNAASTYPQMFRSPDGIFNPRTWIKSAMLNFGERRYNHGRQIVQGI